MDENFTQSGKETGGKMIDWSKCSAVERHPERVSGAWAFRGSSVAQFVECFDGASLDQVQAVLRFITTETGIENGAR
jgi:hypothetical protein